MAKKKPTRARAAKAAAKKSTRRPAAKPGARATTSRSAKRPKASARAKAGKSNQRPKPTAARTAAPKRVATKRPAVARKAAAKKSAVRRTTTVARGKKAAANPPTVKRAVGRTAAVKKSPAPQAVGRKTPRPVRAKATMPAKTATATKPAPSKRPSTLDRARKTVGRENEPHGVPSSLDLDRTASAARSGHNELVERLRSRTPGGPEITAGDVDADWEAAESVGDEAPGGDNPTPDQDVVDEIGRALGVEYDDDEELKGGDEIADRDRHRWELDPGSSEDFDDKDK